MLRSTVALAAMSLLSLSPSASAAGSGRFFGGCSPQKACDFLDRMHEKCIDCRNTPQGEKCGPVPGAPGCDPVSLLCTTEENCVLSSAHLEDVSARRGNPHRNLLPGDVADRACVLRTSRQTAWSGSSRC